MFGISIFVACSLLLINEIFKTFKLNYKKRKKKKKERQNNQNYNSDSDNDSNDFT